MEFSSDEHINEMVKSQLNVVKKYVIEDAKIPMSNVWLFGSCARGKARTSSDIDIAIMTEGSVPLFEREGASRVSIHMYRPSVLSNPTLPIHRNIIKDGKPLTAI